MSRAAVPEDSIGKLICANFEPRQLERKLFGTKQNDFPFAQARQAGFFEQASGGTIVFTHIHQMTSELQEN